MKNFDYYNPVKIYFGKDRLNKLKDSLHSYKKILLIYGGGSILKNGLYSKVKNELSGIDVIDFSGIEANPTYETCMKAVEIIQNENIDFLLAVGGGSVIDATKFISAAALYEEGDPWDILSKGKSVKKAIPLATILTLPATGSEMNMAAVVTRTSTNEKLSFLSPTSFPEFSILMPEFAFTIPKRQVANGIVDTFVHVIEQYVTFDANTPLQDRFAEAILLTLIEEGPKVYNDPTDYNAMCNLMWCSTMALNGTIGSGVYSDWSVHSIGHELTALYNIDHARTLAIVLPGIWKVLRNEKKEKLLQYASRVWNINDGSENERIDTVIGKTVLFFESLDIKTKLADYDVNKDVIDTIANRFKKRGWRFMGDRQLVTIDIVKRVLEYQI